MGMFDSISVNYPLPLPLEVIDEIPDIYNIIFQTKDLECAMELYTIEEGGFLNYLRQDREWVDDDSQFLKGYYKVVNEETVQLNFHGVVCFYAYERIEISETEGLDVSVEYNAKFHDGKLIDLELTEFEIKDASKSIQETKNFFKKIEEERKKWYNKYFFYSKPYKFLKNLIVKRLYKIQNAIGNIRMFIIRYL